MPERGMAVEYNVDPQGSELDQAALATDTVLYVGDASGYDAPGTVRVTNGTDTVDVALVGSDIDAGALTLGAALGIAADIGDRVYILSGDLIAYDHTLEVQTSDGDSHEIAVDFGERALWMPGPIEPPVPVTISDDLTEILDAPGRTALYNADATQAQIPLFIAHLDTNQSIPTGSTYTTVLSWNVSEMRGGMTYDALFGDVIVPIDGYYSISDTAVMWDVNATGRRAIQPRFATFFGDFGGGEVIQDASLGSIRTTTRVATPPKRLTATEKIRLTVSQTSGAALDLLGDTDGTRSFFVVQYVGPL